MGVVPFMLALLAWPPLAEPVHPSIGFGVGSAYGVVGAQVGLSWSHFALFGALGKNPTYLEESTPVLGGGVRFYSGDGQGWFGSLQGTWAAEGTGYSNDEWGWFEGRRVLWSAVAGGRWRPPNPGWIFFELGLGFGFALTHRW